MSGSTTKPTCRVCGGPIEKLSEAVSNGGEWSHAFAWDCVAFCRRPGFSRHGDLVTLTMTVEDFEMVLLALGFIGGSGSSGEHLHNWIALADRINKGNTDYAPYNLEPPVVTP